MPPSNTKRSTNRGIMMSPHRLAVVASVIIFTLANWSLSLRVLEYSQHLNDTFDDVFNSPTQLLVDRSHQWNSNITAFPPFMLQWPTDPFGPSECSILDDSIPHIFHINDYARSYDLDDVVQGVHGNLTQAWNQASASASASATTSIHFTTSNISNNTGTTTDHSASANQHPNSIKMVACSFTNLQFATHFPHQMQHILPCWSLWQHFPDAKHVFLIRKRRYRYFLNGSAFSRGMSDVMRANGIRILNLRMQIFQQRYSAHHGHNSLLMAHSPRAEGFRAAHPDDMPSLRRKILDFFELSHYADQHCGMTESHDEQGTRSTSRTARDGPAARGASNEKPVRPPRIVIINRNRTRQLLGMHNVSSMVQTELELPYRPPVVFLEDMSFEQQVEVFNNIDILLTPHGAQLTSIPFMQQCSSVIEIFPYGYGREEYYGSLAGLSGVNHSYIYLGTDMVAETKEMDTREGQQAARNPPVCAPAFRMIEAIKIQVGQWRRCCGLDV